MLKKLIITGLGTGYLPIAPGTWGSAAVTVIWLAAVAGSRGRWHCVAGTMALLAMAASVGSVALGGYAERAFGKKDPGRVTLDEFAGQAVTYMLLPLPGAWAGRFIVAGAGFVAFRVMDIVKPPPARGLQRIKGGWGILIDDLIAGVYANLLCQIIFRAALHWPRG